MSRQSPPAAQDSQPSPDDDHSIPVDAHGRRPSPAPPPPRSPPPPDPQRRPPSSQHPSLAALAVPPSHSSSSSSQHQSLQPQTTIHARHQLGPGPDQRQHQLQQHQPIPLHLQPAPTSPVQSYSQNRQITLEPQRPSASSPKHQSAKGGVRGRITVVCAEVCRALSILSSSAFLPCAHHLCSVNVSSYAVTDRGALFFPPISPQPPAPARARSAHLLTQSNSLGPHRPCTSCVKRACTERCKYRSELDFVPPPDPPSKPSV